jgi:hypothetical protein
MLSIDYHSVKCRFHLVIAMQLKVSSFLLFKPAVSSQNVVEKTRANETGKINPHVVTSGITTPVLTSEYMSFSLPLSAFLFSYPSVFDLLAQTFHGPL